MFLDTAIRKMRCAKRVIDWNELKLHTVPYSPGRRVLPSAFDSIYELHRTSGQETILTVIKELGSMPQKHF